MDTILISKETKDQLKWLMQFRGTLDAAPTTHVIYVWENSLFAANGFALGQIPIPSDLTEFTDGLIAFGAVALVAKPSILIAEGISIDPDRTSEYFDKRTNLAQFIKTQEIDSLEPTISLNPQLVALLKNISDSGSRWYIKDKNNPVLITSGDNKVIIMPMMGA